MGMRFFFTYTTLSSILRRQVVSDLALRNRSPQTITIWREMHLLRKNAPTQQRSRGRLSRTWSGPLA